MSQEPANRDRYAWIAARARLVFGSYRKDDYADPEVFVTSLIAVLERFADNIIFEATAPETGIAGHCPFPPSIAEFKAFCADLERRRSFKSTWDKRSAEQLAERAEFEGENKRESLEQRAVVAERIRLELKAKGFPVRDTWKRLGDSHGYSQDTK